MTEKQNGQPSEPGDAPFGSITGAAITGLADGALGRVTGDDIGQALTRLPDEVRRGILRLVGLRDMRRPNASAAKTVLVRMRRGELRNRTALRDCFSRALILAFQNNDRLSADDCVLLLQPDSALTALGRAPHLASTLRMAALLPEPITWWALTRAIEEDVALAPVALGLLQASADELGVDMAAALRDAWAGLRSREPVLPELPLSLAQLLHAAAAGDDATREDIGMVDASPGELNSRLESVRDAYAFAGGATGRLLTAFKAGRRPEAEDLEAVNDAVALFHALREVLGGESIADFADAVGALAAHAVHENSIRSLIRIQGPPSLEDVLTEVREAAAKGSPAELHLLAELIELASDPEADVGELVEQVRVKLPAGWSRMITAVSRGQISLRPLSPDSAAEATEPPAGGQRKPPTPDEPETDGGPEPRGAAVTDSGREPPQRQEPQTARPPHVAEEVGPDDGPSDADIELDELDELLIGEANRAGRTTVHRPIEMAESTSLEAAGSGGDSVVAAGTGSTSGPGPLDAGAPISARQSNDESDIPPDAAAAEATALRQGRFGLASWIRMACERPAAEVQARRAAALARELSDYAGLVSAAFTETASAITRDGLLQDDAGQLLAWSASIRAGIIQPTPESARLLQELAPIVAAHPGLTALGEAFTQASVSTIFLVPSVSDQLRGTVQAEERQAGAVAAAAKLLDEGPRRKIRLQRATDVWRKLLQEESPVGSLLAIAATDETEQIEKAEKLLNKLRASGVVDRLIDDTAAKVKSSPSKSKIIAGARKTLTEYIGEAIECGAAWVTAVHKVEASRRSNSGGRGRDTRLTDLLHETAAVREQAMAELDQLATAPEPMLAAAAGGASLLISQTLELLEGVPLSKEPATPGQVLGRDLLLAAEVRLASGNLEPTGKLTLEQLIPVARREPDWEAAFEARADLDDHDGTQAILAVLQRIDPQLAATLRKRRDELVTSAEKRRAIRIETTRDLLARLRHDGVLGENEATRLEGVLEALRTAEREDYGRQREQLDALHHEISDRTAHSKALVRDDLANTGAKPSVADRISAYIDRADLTTAREFIAQTVAGRELPSAVEDRGHFSRFYPGFPQTFGALGMNRGHREAITQLIDVLPTAEQVTDPRLRSLLNEAGIDLGALRRPEIGRDALRQWRQIAQSPMTSGQLPTAVARVLRALGAEGQQTGGKDEKYRTWITLDRIRTGHALLPAFGSHKSPSGDSLRLLLVWNHPGPKEIIDLVKDEPGDHTVLVWYFGVLSPADRRQLAAESRRRPRPAVAVLDDAAIGYLACLPEPDWSAMVGILAPFTSVNPFAPTGDVPEEMFYGRADQLDAVMGRKGGSFVYGGRQLGKSALLRAAERRLQRSDPERVVVRESVYHVGRDAPVESVWASLRRPLADAGVISPTLSGSGREEMCHAIRDWAAVDQGRQLLILLDETDEFLNKDAETTRFTHVKAFWELMDGTGHRVKIVFAGLHQTARFRSLPNQPLAHFGAPVSIGPLAPQDAFDLLTKPLAALGFQLPDTLAARVIAEANNAPALIQLFADALLTRLRQAPVGEHTFPYDIRREDLDAVWADPKLAQDFRDRFEWTIDLDKRYKVIAYAVALHALSEGADSALTAGLLSTDCQGWWPQGFENLSSDAFRGLLEECVELGILARDRELFRLRTPHILTLLGGAGEVEEVLDKAGSFELPDSFDAQSYRTAYQDGQDRSPLTCGQVSRLLERRAQVYVVAGSDALHLERVAKALQAEADRHRDVKLIGIRAGLSTFDGTLETARRHPGQTIGLIDLSRKTLFQAIDQIRAASAAVRQHGVGAGLAVVCLAPPVLAPLWLAVRNPGANPSIDLGDEAQLIELRRFSAASVRQWMHAETLPFQDAEGQETLLAVTGGWPSLISSMFSGPAVNDRGVALDQCQAQLRDRPGDLVRAAGVLTCPPLATAWRTLVDYGSPDVPTELAELLTMTDSPDLTTEVLRTHGHQGASDVIETIRMLGALVPVAGEEHRLRCEPVLAQATKDMGDKR